MVSGLGKGIRDGFDSVDWNELERMLNQKGAVTLSPEAKERAAYQAMKQAYYWHPSCWYMRDWTRGYDGNGCNDGKCAEDCPYFPDKGRLVKTESGGIIVYDDGKVCPA